MSRNTWWASVATMAVVVVTILGFRDLGGPGTQRLVQTDLHTERGLSTLAYAVNGRWNALGKTLPPDLDRFSAAEKKDPTTGKPFDYRPGANSEYQLCATFSAASRDAQQGTSAFWNHPKGDYCFNFDAGRPVPPVPYYSGY